jgi:hypothetical protein
MASASVVTWASVVTVTAKAPAEAPAEEAPAEAPAGPPLVGFQQSIVYQHLRTVWKVDKLSFGITLKTGVRSSGL